MADVVLTHNSPPPCSSIDSNRPIPSDTTRVIHQSRHIAPLTCNNTLTTNHNQPLVDDICPTQPHNTPPTPSPHTNSSTDTERVNRQLRTGHPPPRPPPPPPGPRPLRAARP